MRSSESVTGFADQKGLTPDQKKNGLTRSEKWVEHKNKEKKGRKGTTGKSKQVNSSGNSKTKTKSRDK